MTTYADNCTNSNADKLMDESTHLTLTSHSLVPISMLLSTAVSCLYLQLVPNCWK